MQSEVQNVVLSEDDAHRGDIDDRSAPRFRPQALAFGAPQAESSRLRLRTHCALAMCRTLVCNYG